jgi:quinol monooxygenase YgiN
MNPQGTIVVLARWQLSAHSVEGVLDLLAELREQTLAEPGCQGYDVFRSTASPEHLLLLERYRDDAAIAAHRASTHYQALVVQRILPLIADRKVELLRAIEPA